MIKIGDRVPDATLSESTEFGEACPLSPKTVSVAEATRGKRVVVFGLPGAYTPTCSAKHVPGYVDQLPQLKARKVDEVWCVSLNDGYVMAAWGRDQKAIGKIRMLGDGNGELASKLGLEVDLSKAGLGRRMQRFSMLLDDGIVKQLNVEVPGKFDVSDAATMVSQLGG
jgi:glutaredoxin/glutathione-dependent peroxiredoxin